MAGFVIDGLEDALKKMDEMTKNVAKKHAKKAAREAAKIMQKAAKENAKRIDSPETAEMIHKNIVVRSGKTQDKNEIKFRVGVKGGGQFWRSHKQLKRKSEEHRRENPWYTPIPNDTRHFWLVEFGTVKTKAQPYLRPAMIENIQNMTNEFANELKEAIYKDIKE
ncbi:HK97-gp10 family putative phage morphogenesis protein [Acinetobacter lwoffii]|uniref:HK97-gp10 family putative phage morphogenesis protein n=1 Tax=Acinetobacter lwoffii TaxID=28090 RepID=UPI002DB840EB|nr:HK97-gp10 family putative phage morphogenesis protein [Acinetobacter lwoffii]MEB6680282.1 HK97 gp10 family phage protein [Acinetobacter lwoffii]